VAKLAIDEYGFMMWKFPFRVKSGYIVVFI